MTALLHLDNLSVARGGFEILSGISLEADAGKVTVLLGANGAGKTTLLESISGVIPSGSGSIVFDGSDVTAARRRARATRGLAHVEQGRAIFADLTVDQNLIAGAPRDELDRAFDLFPALATRRNVAAGSLSGGEQQMLVIARAIIGNPKMLMLDEISLGLAPKLVALLMPVVRELAEGGIGILLVEQFAELALAIGDSVHVLSRGSVVFTGTCEELRESPDVLQGAYLARGVEPASNEGLVR